MKADLLEFLKDLKNNNNREWFQENKSRYEKARTEFEAYINKLIPRIREFDPEIGMLTARDCMFRIYRDVRFATDKSPYKTNMGAYIARGGKGTTMPGYYVHMEPGSSFLAGGLYMPPPEILKKIRDEIYFQPEEFKNIVFNKSFIRVFGEIDDSEKLKTAPKGYPKDFPDLNLIKFRNYAVMHWVTDEQTLSDVYDDYAIEVFKVLLPLNEYFYNLLK